MESHPEYLLVNQSKGQAKENLKNEKQNLNAITLSISQGIENVKDIFSPNEILKERMARAHIQ